MIRGLVLPKTLWRPVLFAALAALALSFSALRVFEAYELHAYDWRCQLRSPRPVSPDLVLVEIADDTLAKIGQWPFSREYHAALIDVLGEAGARAVVFDILFVEPSAQDDQVAAAARRHGNVYFASAYENPRFDGVRYNSAGLIAPLLKGYAEAAKGIGCVNVNADMDGKRRSIAPVVYHDGRPAFQLGVLVAMELLGVSQDEVTPLSGSALRLGSRGTIPLDGQGDLLVSFAGRWSEAFEHYSYADILTSYVQIADRETPTVDLKRLKGKICFVGFTATASHDTNATPLEPVYPMVGIHANVLNGILTRDFIWRAGRLPNLLVLSLLGWAILAASLRMRPIASFRTSLSLLVLFTCANLFSFVHFGLWLDLFYPLALGFALYAVATLGRTLSEIRKRELIESELRVASQIQKSFLPPAVPSSDFLDIAAFMRPAKAVSGDLYAFVPLAEGKLGVMLGDVSGKGTPAALFMAKTVSEFKFSARDATDPAGVLERLNDSVASESTGGLFVTLCYAIFDAATRSVALANGGHLPLVVVPSEGPSSLLTSEEGMPIGVLAGVPFGKTGQAVRDGESYALYSDGVSEARNRRREEYGVERLQRVLESLRGKPAQAMLEEAINDLEAFTGKAEQHDDMTLVIVKVKHRDHGR